MSTNNCIERRIAEYSQLIESFKEEIKVLIQVVLQLLICLEWGIVMNKQNIK